MSSFQGTTALSALTRGYAGGGDPAGAILLLHRTLPPAVAAGLVLLFAAAQEERLQEAALVALLIAATQTAVTRQAPRASLLKLVRLLYPLAGPVITLTVLVLLKGALVLPGLALWECVLVCAAAALAAVGLRGVMRLIRGKPVRIRIAVVGSARTAEALASELSGAQRDEFEIVGYLSSREAPDLEDEAQGHERSSSTARLRRLGSEREVVTEVEAHAVDLVLLSSDASRMTFFNALASTPPSARLRAAELSTFYEEVFGRVPLGSINAAWFQWMVHSYCSTRVSSAKRALDVTLALALGLALLPLLAVLGLLIRRDGGPVLYRQTRIGEQGRPFQILKLRSMRHEAQPQPERWSSSSDERVTSLGARLRRSHLDELPQLWNVLVGEMSVVGPRPEQPSFVERLERSTPFYTRRHLIRPGITGWAQISCGYAGSDEGSTWKLSHDLFYLKHRSFAFDVLVLLETLRTLVADRQYATEEPVSELVYRRTRIPVAVLEATTPPVLDEGPAPRRVESGVGMLTP